MYFTRLLDSEDEAINEMFDSNYSMLESHMESDQLEELNEGVTREKVQEMGDILRSGDVDIMRKFVEENPECNDSGELVEPGDTFIMNRKFIFNVNGNIVTGKKLNKL